LTPLVVLAVLVAVAPGWLAPPAPTANPAARPLAVPSTALTGRTDHTSRRDTAQPEAHR
jgi:hypothetical protein